MYFPLALSDFHSFHYICLLVAMASKEENFNIPLPPEPKKKRVNCFAKCVICQIDRKNETLRKAKESSVQTLIRAINLRKDEVYNRLRADLSELCNRELQWHSSCYAAYTSEHNIRHSLPAKEEGGEILQHGSADVGSRLSRSFSEPTDWSKCFICGNKTHKKIKDLHNICTFEACTSILKAAESKSDEKMLHVLRSSNNDLIAAEGKYHKSCFASYVSKSNIKHQSFQEEEGESLYDAAFKELAVEISEGIAQGKAYDMITLLSSYRERLEEKGVDGSAYTKQRLKLRFQKYFEDRIVFHQQSRKNSPEVIYSSQISIQDVLNAAAQASQKTSHDDDPPITITTELVLEVARWLRNEIKKCDGISLTPLNVNDVSLSSARRVISNSLYWMIRLIVTSDETGLEDLDSLSSCKRKEDERRVLSIAQDIIHCSTNARAKMPKQISLAMTVHHLTVSKQLVTILNRMGHCSSYDELKAVDTSLAMEVMAKAEEYGTVVPSNISPGAFVQLAADNNDLNEETLDGKNTTHATTMVVFQRKVYGPEPPPTAIADHTNRRRSLPESGSVYEVLECSAHGRRPAVTQYVHQVKNEWFSSQSEILSNALKDDEIWLLLRMKLTGLTPATVMAHSVPGWSGYNAILYPDLPPSSCIGYCPMIEGPSTDFSTVYTVLKHAQKISESVGQAEAVITFDLAIYTKAKQIQMRFPEKFSNTVIRLGGFHVALNFLSLLGKKFMNSGLDDLLIESAVYAAGTTSVIMKGKSYNRGVRVHKLSMEALYRLMWSAFAQWCGNLER